MTISVVDGPALKHLYSASAVADRRRVLHDHPLRIVECSYNRLWHCYSSGSCRGPNSDVINRALRLRNDRDIERVGLRDCGDLSTRGRGGRGSLRGGQEWEYSCAHRRERWAAERRLAGESECRAASIHQAARAERVELEALRGSEGARAGRNRSIKRFIRPF